MTMVVPFKEGTVPGLQPQGGFLREQEGTCTLKNSVERTMVLPVMYVCMYSVTAGNQ